MARRLEDKLTALDPARRARIEAEADRLRKEYLNHQPQTQDAQQSDDTSEKD